MAKKPENPILQEHEKKFEEYLHRWQERLNLTDWRIVREKAKARGVIAEVRGFETNHRLVKYRLGRDAGLSPVTDQLLEMTAIHELLHVLLHVPLETAAEDGDYTDRVMAAEHAAINVLEGLLYRLAELERIVTEAVKTHDQTA